MTSVVFQTPTLIPIEAFTIFGLNAKPNSVNPIGYFGTGLKYAIAVLVREGIRIRVFIGHTEYEFYGADKDFRGKSFVTIRMRHRRGLLRAWTYTQLPFTTEYGKNWELWQALRELESNTRDEQGTSYVLHDYHEPTFPVEGKTFIVIESELFVDTYKTELHNIFLDKNRVELRFKNEQMEVYNSPSRYLYYRGLRVYDLDKQSTLYTYNYTRTMDLTEDRTLKYMFYAKSHLAETVVTADDREFIHQVVSCKDPGFEANLDFALSVVTPGKTFIDTMKARTRSGAYSSAGFSGFYHRYSSPAARLDSPPSDDAPLVEHWEYQQANNYTLRNEESLKRLVARTIEVLNNVPRSEQPLALKDSTSSQPAEGEVDGGSIHTDSDGDLIPF